MGAPAPSRRFIVDGRGVWLFDDLLDDTRPYVDALSQAPFTRTDFARPDTAGYRRWVMETRLDAPRRQPIWALGERTASAAAPKQRYVPYRAYTDIGRYGDMLVTHVDCLPGQGGLTAVWYLCESWDVEWGGETVFFDAADEIALAVPPRPGRLVIFDGAINHVARPPNRTCYHPRYMFAIKLQPAA
ncbi:MAG: 2OG-Fe(II) oxygenase [Pseudomonadota bacterium]